LYLVHLFVFQSTRQIIGLGPWPYIIAVGLSLLAAWLFYETVEKWALRTCVWLQQKYFEKLAPPANRDIEKEIARQP
jgi:peptidoglycan/LPS O-acetylase OafA/YrhL